VIVSIGLYLHQERDGYSRDLAMRIMLWGAGAVMAVNFFLNFLRIFNWQGHAPPFAELYAFCGAVVLAKITYKIANPLPAE
jgi:hypothetical protein